MHFDTVIPFHKYIHKFWPEFHGMTWQDTNTGLQPKTKKWPLLHWYLQGSAPVQGVHWKLCFSQLTATHPLHELEQLVWSQIWLYSHSFWLTIFCQTNSSPVLARERSKNIENSWEKSTIINEHLVSANFIHISFYSIFFFMKLKSRLNEIELHS